MPYSYSRIPATPRVISASPTPPPNGTTGDGYFPPVTRSASKARVSPAIEELDGVDDSDFELKRARTRSRSPVAGKGYRRRISGLTSPPPKAPSTASSPPNGHPPQMSNGHLQPPESAATAYWRTLSRSPSPLGLIPIHRHFRSLVHRHEVPRKLLHVSIGILTLSLYMRGYQTWDIHPYLLAAFIPIFTTDLLRHRFASFNRFYISVLGAFMREGEVDGFNGVIWYLAGTWVVLKYGSKDVGVVAVLLLSWCDTAASTVGRAWGRYTPRLRRGKSLAGSAAAFVVGVITALAFWGYYVPRAGAFAADPPNPYMFTGTLSLPPQVTTTLGLKAGAGKIGGWAALGVLSLWTGLVGSLSELVDFFNIDDNLTIPVLSGLGLWGFLKVFG